MCGACEDALPERLRHVGYWNDVLNPAKAYLRKRYKEAQKFLAEQTQRWSTGKKPDWHDAREVFELSGNPYPSGVVDRLRLEREVDR